MDKLIRDAYLDPSSPSYLAGISAVYQQVRAVLPGVRVRDVRENLEKLDVHNLHKPVRRRFSRNRVTPCGLDSDWQADLIDFHNLAKYNKNHNYILVVVDILSKYAWAYPLKNKSAATVAVAFESIIVQSQRKCWRLMTDSGREFTGKPFQDLMKKQDIRYFNAPSPDVKAPNVERLIRTLKTRLWKHFTLKKTYDYLTILPKIVAAYNGTRHSVTKHTPASINYGNAREIMEIAFKKTPIGAVKFKYKIGQTVRISIERGAFTKGYLPGFSNEVFVVRERLVRRPPAYRVAALNGEHILGLFYHQELSPVGHG